MANVVETMLEGKLADQRRIGIAGVMPPSVAPLEASAITWLAPL
ncbi:MAG: hypothetical protein AAB676_03215 [Verrucomicrobiota bacterium]